MRSYDVVVLSDLRFPGGNSTAIAAELDALVRAGYRVGVIQVRGPILKFPHPIHPQIRSFLDNGQVDLIDPESEVRAGAAVAHHPGVFANPLLRPLNLRADHRLLIVEHPPLDGVGVPQYDIGAVDVNCAEALCGAVTWAPMSPVVRRQFEALSPGVRLRDGDWHSVIDVDRFASDRHRLIGSRPIVGRHSRPDLLKWPDTLEEIVAAYPVNDRILVRILGAPPAVSGLFAVLPPNWTIIPFNAEDVPSFLRGIDFFVFMHSVRWLEAFGRAALEAMSAGRICLLPEYFRPLFGDSALYCQPNQVRELVLAMAGDPPLFEATSKAAEMCARDRYSLQRHVERVRDLVGPPAKGRAAVSVSRPVGEHSGGIMFITSDGVGMGHLTRLLAIARRCPTVGSRVFVSMSQAVRVVREFGYPAEYIPFHRYLGASPNEWNRELRRELNEFMAFYAPRLVVFDGNLAYKGLLEAILERKVTSVWCRRAMWSLHSSENAIESEKAFDLVIEPGEIAGEYDMGMTARHRSRTRLVDPILLLDDHEMLTRAEARAELGLDPDRPACLLQLGSGNNWNYASFANAAVRELVQSDVQAVFLNWLISDSGWDFDPAVKQISVFPVAKYLHAFDFAISASGYNSYHELVLSGVPTIFVPNENPEMDNQFARAVFAQRHGLGLCLTTRDLYRLPQTVATMLDARQRDQFRRRCSALSVKRSGARQAATILEEYCLSVRADLGWADILSNRARLSLAGLGGKPSRL